MPRPGPRGYECVKRAWHFDGHRHQPMRGSIIQQIFRVVNEVHSSATRKNKEWQLKLPRVVFKAEEILYSKANSEAEYMDPETLWERLNDAIDTIIRRDKSAEETGEFLQPCIEAALVLGCVPVKASRSQQQKNVRSYLSPRVHESTRPTQLPPQLPTPSGNHSQLLPPLPTPSGNHLATSSSSMGNQTTSISPFNSVINPNTNHISTHTNPHFLSTTIPVPSMDTESNTLLNCGSVYPLYYGNHSQNIEFQDVYQPPQTSIPDNVVTGTSFGWPAEEPFHCISTRNLLSDGSARIEAGNIGEVKQVEAIEIDAEKACDLSLRLGPSNPSTSLAKGFTCVTKDGGSSSHQESEKHYEPYSKNFEFCFFPRHNASDPSDIYGSRPAKEGDI